MKIEWLVTDVTAVGSPGRAEFAIFGGNLAFFVPIQALFVGGEPLCGVETPSLALISLLRVI